jgi:hypothetical protein
MHTRVFINIQNNQKFENIAGNGIFKNLCELKGLASGTTILTACELTFTEENALLYFI